MKRVVSGLVLVSLLGFAIWSQSPYYFLTLATIVLALALWEFFQLAKKVGCNPHQIQGYLAATLIVYASTQSNNPEKIIIPTIVVLLTTMMITSLFESKTSEDFAKVLNSVAATLLGVCYVVLLASFLLAVKFTANPYPKSSQLLSLFFLIIVASDTAAYYVGSNLGKNKLVPLISPGKTVEGSIGGLLGAITAALVSRYTFFPQLPLVHALVLAVVMNIISQMGDLFESLLKRGSGAKDAASIIPGHGGLLDRLDSVLFNAPILYYYFLFLLPN